MVDHFSIAHVVICVGTELCDLWLIYRENRQQAFYGFVSAALSEEIPLPAVITKSNKSFLTGISFSLGCCVAAYVIDSKRPTRNSAYFCSRDKPASTG